ncbi:hypothetical protein OG369_09985 [Streptomyces sp. NBC_01221]|uniref:hypothetical protein n=1 Tax=Streptomyces sp. NBC_01221 TaxID=2903782 RepID=UPI002258649F|nr:hypothetical protein [Streptomyces sp. NBC_01221]MCX4786501.1 hypothetical protein [Streptomyces sp. NBC_01221]
MTDSSQAPARTLTEAEAVIAELAHALRLTHEYVGGDLLPAVEGWSWYDALRRHAPEVARQVRDTTDQQQAPAAPLSVVWTVWREDEPTYAYFATEAAAKQGTIDCWQEDEPSCPDYGWRQDGPRLELMVGGEHGGVYVSRHRVYGTRAAELRDRIRRAICETSGQGHLWSTDMLEPDEYGWQADAVLAVLPAPVDRAAILREAEARVRETALGYPEKSLSWHRTLDAAVLLRRMADEAQQPSAPSVADTQPETEAHPAEHSWAAEMYDPLADEWVPGTRYVVRDRAVNHLEHASTIGPTWKDGTPVKRRLVRATTTYTVEPAPTATAPEPPTIDGIIRTIHTKHPNSPHCEHDGESWPCPTITALDRTITPAVTEEPK